MPGQRAFESMHGCYTPVISRLCRSVLGENIADPGLATEEVVQDTWFDASQGLVERFRPDKAVSPWLALIARRRACDAIDRYRAQRRSRSGDVQLLDITELESYRLAAAKEESEAESHMYFSEMMARLEPVRTDRRRLLVARAIGLTDVQLADMDGVPLGTMKSRIRFAREEAQSHLGGRA